MPIESQYNQLPGAAMSGAWRGSRHGKNFGNGVLQVIDCDCLCLLASFTVPHRCSPHASSVANGTRELHARQLSSDAQNLSNMSLLHTGHLMQSDPAHLVLSWPGKDHTSQQEME